MLVFLGHSRSHFLGWVLFSSLLLRLLWLHSVPGPGLTLPTEGMGQETSSSWSNMNIFTLKTKSQYSSLCSRKAMGPTSQGFSEGFMVWPRWSSLSRVPSISQWILCGLNRISEEDFLWFLLFPPILTIVYEGPVSVSLSRLGLLHAFSGLLFPKLYQKRDIIIPGYRWRNTVSEDKKQASNCTTMMEDPRFDLQCDSVFLSEQDGRMILVIVESPALGAEGLLDAEMLLLGTWVHLLLSTAI